MSRTTSEWVLSLKDNISPALGSVMTNVQKFGLEADKALGQFGAKAFRFNQLAEAAGSLNQVIEDVSGPGRRLNREVGELASMVELTDAQVKALTQSGRDLARTYGGDASDAMGAMQAVLSATTPELAKHPAAIRGITNNVILMSKTMRGDVQGATGALVTAMNAYGISFDNPNLAMAQSTRLMDMITKGALVGSATVPRISAAMETLGGTAASANVSFAETQAALQILDQKGFKKGAEGGIAFRNVLLKMGEGKFIPKETRAALAAAGVDVAKLADTSLPLAERLRQLERVPKDLLSKFFGVENVVGAEALVRNISTLRTFTGQIANESAGAAQKAAQAVMNTDEERMARWKARIDDWKISIYNGVGGAMPFISQATTSLAALGMAGPGLLVIKQGFMGIWSGAKWMAIGLIDGLKWMRASVVSLGAYTVALWQNRAAHLMNTQIMLVMARTRIVSMLASMATALRMTTAAQWLLNVAMSANPLGVVIAALAALGTGVYVVIRHWDTLKNYLGAFGKFLWNLFLYSNPIGWMILGVQKLMQIFPSLRKIFTDVFDAIKRAWDSVWNGISKALGWISSAVGLSDPGSAGDATNNAGGDIRSKLIDPITGKSWAELQGGGSKPPSPDNPTLDLGGGGGGGRKITVTFGTINIMPGATINSVGDLAQIRRLVTELVVGGITDAEELAVVAG